MKNPDKETLKKILSQPYITMDDLYKVLPVGRKQSDHIFSDLEKKLGDEGVELYVTRPRIIPTESLKRYLKEKKKAGPLPMSTASSSDIKISNSIISEGDYK